LYVEETWMVGSTTRPITSALSRALVLGAIIALLLVGYGVLRTPTTNLLSVRAAALMLVIYALLGWLIPPQIARHNAAIVALACRAGLLAGAIFALGIEFDSLASRTPLDP
jgi:hypothetical protein